MQPLRCPYRRFGEVFAEPERHLRLLTLVEMRFFGGMTAEETADAMGESVNVVRHDLRYAQAWLRRTLESRPPV